MFKKTNQHFRFFPILFALVCAVFSHAAWDGTYPDINAYTPSDTTIDGKKFYKIASEKDLAWFTMKVYRNGGNAKNTNAIVTVPYLDMGAKWFLPIGAGDGTTGIFSGIFDGNGATIANLIIDNDSLEGVDRQNSAFIGSLKDGGTVRNLIIEDITVNARGNGDGLGFLLNGTISSSIGTIVGWLANGTIENCYASGNIKTNGSNQRVGGIVGIGANGTIKNCLSVVDIDANGEREVFVGGIIGTVRRGSSVKIDGCAYDGKFISLHEGGATGKIIGKIETGTTINHTYFAKEGLAACHGDKPHTCNANGVDDLNTEEIACKLNAGTWDGHACSNATSNVWSTGVRITNKGVSRDDDGNTIFTISYDANGGQYAPGSPNPQKKYLKRNEKITGEGIPAPTKSGSVFVGWAKSSDATDPEDLGNVEKVVTVYAVWKDAITITFVDNYTDGHGKTPREPQEKVFAKGSEITATGIIAPEPYQFDDKKYFASGWAATSDGELLDPLGTADANKTLYTKWTAIDAEKFTVTFKANGHGEAPETQAIVENNTATAPTAPVATGYTFKGWFTEAACTNAFEFSTPITEDMTLFAKWEPTPYTITYKFKDNNGDLADVDNSLNTATSYTIETNLALNAASKTGYTFKGWFKDAAFTERVTGISEGSTGNVTLYAQFEEIIYTIKYLSGKMGNGYIDNEYKHFDETITISTQKFMSPAQRQDGWTTVDMTGEKVYDFGDEYSTNDTLTLFPHWGDSILYTISYENMEGRQTPSPTTFYYNTTNAIILETPESDTVNFMGWYTEANFLNKINQLNPRTFGDTTVYAKWTAKLVFDGQGRAASSYREELPGTIIADPGAPSSSQPEFTFDKWYDDQDYTTEHDFSKPLTKNDTVYAKWISQEHKLHIDYVFPEGYVKPAGITEPAAVDSMVMYGTIYNIVSPEVTGHSPSLTKVYGTMELHDTTFTVTYTPNKYKISFMGSTSLIAECTMNYDYGTTPACEAPTKAATDDSTYTFSGWDPEIAMVTDVATYRATFTASPKKKKIIAYYGEGGSDYVHFLVPFESTDEEVEEKVDSVLKRRDYYPPQKAPTVETTYAFKDWSYGINPETGLLTFTPNFTDSPREYSITFNGYNNKPITTINVAYGTVPEYEGTTPTKPEGIFYTYAFKAWTPEPVAVAGNATYTATFDSTAKENVITVKYNGNDTDTLLVTVLLIDDEETINHKVDSALAARNIELERTATDEYTYTFNKWQVKEDIQTGELTYIALFDSTRNAYEITFVDFDGTELKKVSLEYGRLPSYSPAPTRTETEDYTYTFTGWSPAIAAVTKKQTYTAQYDSSVKHIDVLVQYGEQPADTFTLTVGVSENIPKTIKNALAEKGITPEKATTDEYYYTYTGSWNVTTEGGKTIYSPKFTATKRKYLITFINAGMTLKQDSLEYGATPTCDTPTRKETTAFKYTFTGWTPAIATVTKEATYTAQFDSVFKFSDIVVKYGDKATDTLYLKVDSRTDITEQIEAALASKNITPTKASTDEFEYTYANTWSVSNVNGQAVYSPVFSSAKRKYLVSFVSAGTVVKKDSLEYGTRPSCENPTRKETATYTYTFTGWSPAVSIVTKNATYTAEYDSVVKKVEIVVSYDSAKTDTIHVTIEVTDSASQIQAKIAEEFDKRRDIDLPTKEEDDKYIYTFETFVKTDSDIYVAQFSKEARTYAINYHLPRNGKLSEEVNTYTFGKTTLLPSAYIKNDSTWIFKGWYEKANGLGERYKAVKATETGDKNVYPLFQKSVTYKTKDTTGTIIVTYAGGDERNTIEQILSGIIPKDYDKDKKTYAFDRWVLEDGVYVAQYAEKVSIGARALAPSFSVTVHGRALEVFGAKIGAKIAIFDLSGRIVHSGIVSNGTTHLELPQSGSYVVRINNQAIRVTAK